jgi:two-component system, chemotaxis family, chemotaxis protein CheY
VSAPIHFLVVDDDAASRATIVEYLKALGHARVTEASNGVDALHCLDRDSSISFIISDWDMPHVNGLTLLQRVKADPVRARLPFLIVTSPISEEAEKVVLAAENLVDAYLIKPFRSQVLAEKIGKILATPVRGGSQQGVVVDDDPDSRQMLAEYLRQMGFRDVAAFPDGRAALDHLSQPGVAERVSLIVADWEMPELTGMDLLRACKGQPGLAEIPFLMVTSQSSLERMKVLQAAKSQVDQYLLKPFDLGEIRKRVETMLEKARNRTQVQELTQEATEHLEHGRYQRAQEKLEEALSLDPTHDLALRSLGDVLIKTKGVETALPFYKKAVEAAPMNPRGYLRLSAAYEQIGWIDKAVTLLQHANKTITFNAELHFHLGRLYNKKDMAPLAKAEFEKTLEIQLDHQEARLMLEMLGHGRKGSG